MIDRYLVPKALSFAELDIKRSRFLAYAACAESRGQALEFLQQIKRKYPDARHHCWAYQIGSPQSPSTAAFSDDGEPGGTAGKPMLSVIQHKNVGDIVVVVVRYFGGIKLGAGGLVRAYGSAVQLVMEGIHTQEKILRIARVLSGDYKAEQALRRWLDQHEGILDGVVYEVPVTYHVRVSADTCAALDDFAQAYKMDFIKGN